MVRPLARDPRVLVGWPLPLGFGLDERLLLERRGRVYVQFSSIIIIITPAQHRASRKKDGAVASQLTVGCIRTRQTAHFAPASAHEIKSTATCACALVPGGEVTNGFS